jgi:hemolysin III
MAKNQNVNVLTLWEQEWGSRPLLRGWLHVAALPAALGSTALLALKRKKHRKPVIAYGAGLSTMLAASSAYHRLTRNESWAEWTRPLDHAMIFAAIAGSATPIASVVLPQKAFKPAMVALWGTAAVGAAGRANDIRHDRRGVSPSNVAYLVLGWTGAALLPSVVRKKGVVNGALIATGGLSYTVGAVLFALRQPNFSPKVFGYHEVWHTFTLIGAVSHMIAIANMTRDTQEKILEAIELEHAVICDVCENECSCTAYTDV